MEITKESVQQEITKYNDYTSGLVILSKEEFDKSQTELAGIKKIEKQIDFLYDDSISAAKKALDTIKKAKEVFSQPIKEIRERIAKAQRDFYFEVERKRKEEQAALDKRRREEEEKRLLDEAIKIEEQKKKLVESGKTEEADRLAARADRILETPVNIKPIEIKPDIQVDKRSFRKIWKFRITNVSDVPREFMVVDEKQILAKARETDGQAKIPGIEFFYE